MNLGSTLALGFTEDIMEKIIEWSVTPLVFLLLAVL